jgi:hypothetical protein
LSLALALVAHSPRCLHLHNLRRKRILNEVLAVVDEVRRRLVTKRWTLIRTSTPAIHPHLHIIRFLVRLLGLMHAN